MAAAWRRRRRLGESDCEQIRTGLIAQPINTLSSLAYVAGGGWVAARGVQAGRPAAVAFGALLGAVGAGSILYHGPCPPGAQQAHDSSLAAALGFVVLHNTAAVTGRPRTVSGVVQLGAAVAAALPVLPTGRFTNQVVAVLGLAAVATEAVSVRDHRAAGPSAAAAVSLAARRDHQRPQPHGRPAVSSRQPPPGPRRVAHPQRLLSRSVGAGGAAAAGLDQLPLRGWVRSLRVTRTSTR